MVNQTNVLSEPKLLIDGLHFPEGPRWRDGRLWFSDMGGHSVMTLRPGEAPETIFEHDDAPSGLGWLPDGSLLITSVYKKLLLRYKDGELSVHADLAEAEGDCINDMVVDGSGGAYIGTRHADMDVDHPEAIDTLVYVSPDGQMSTAAEGITSPNGSVFIGDRLIVAETYAHRLIEFKQLNDGTLTGRRLFAQTGELFPDGIWNDAEGAIWIASPFTGQFGRITPDGRVSDEIHIEKKIGVACVLGGEDDHTLFLLCAGERGVARVWSEEAGRMVPAPDRPTSSGAIYSIEVAIPAGSR